MPRFKQGIQYAEHSRLEDNACGLLDHPLLRVMTARCAAQFGTGVFGAGAMFALVVPRSTS